MNSSLRGWLRGLPLGLLFFSACLPAASSEVDTGSNSAARYLRVSVDNLVIDTDGLVAVSAALAQLATDLPRTAQDPSEQLPRLINEARAPIAELSSSLQKASDGIVTLTESLPQATENAKALVNSAVDSVLLRGSIFVVILLTAIALATIWIIGFIYKSYFDPLAKKPDALVGAPEHFASLARQMKETSDNLLVLQATASQTGATDTTSVMPVEIDTDAENPRGP